MNPNIFTDPQAQEQVNGTLMQLFSEGSEHGLPAILPLFGYLAVAFIALRVAMAIFNRVDRFMLKRKRSADEPHQHRPG